jgi:homoserine O-succinyltransferase
MDLTVALVNNMPDAALAAAERQFRGLVGASAGALRVRVDLYALSRVPRSVETRVAMARRYGGLDDLMAARPDVLIVTGAEPLARDLADEAYWGELTQLIDWARAGGVSAALYSCLAAHAAVLFTDGIRRRRLPAKLCGVFAAEVARAHELTEGVSSPLTPHSRYNDLDERELTDKGYVVLTRSARAGVGAFAREDAILEAFWQGHPEYEADTLARELRRDLHRIGAAAPVPENYLSPEARARVDACRKGLTAEIPPLEILSPETALWAANSRRLMGAFLAAAWRRRLRTREAMEASLAGL